MPNWCYTNITINHESEDKVKELERLIDEWTSKNYTENGFGKNWLGNIVLGSGVGTVDTKSETDLRCRGTVENYDVNGNELTITTETAWVPFLKMWKKIIDKYLPDAELIYSTDESGMDVTYTNDPCLAGRYIFDYYDEDINVHSDWEMEEQTLVEVLQELLSTEVENVEELIKLAHDNLEVGIRKWKYAEVDEWD